MVLASLMMELGYPFGVAHVDHTTREGTSRLDRNFVHEWAAMHNMAFHDTTVDFKNEQGNFHDLAHKARYAFFLSLPYELIMTAHHKDDVVESIFINFLNGRSLDGIVNNDKFIRPLLPFSKEEIMEYALQNEIAFREDVSNAENKYLRNVIRNKLVPIIKDFLPDYKSKIQSLASRTRVDNELLEQMVERDKKQLLPTGKSREQLSLKLDIMRKFSATHIYYLLKEYGINRTQASNLKQLSDSSDYKGKTLLTSDFRFVFGADDLIISGLVSSGDAELCHRVSALPACLAFNDYQFNVDSSFLLNRYAKSDELLINKSDLGKTLTIRTWKDGDKITPLGMKGQTKSLKKIFADAKVNIIEKHQIPIFLLDDKIVWVCGLAVAESQRVEAGNTDFLIRIAISEG